jgi:hypothetical protein
MIPNEEVEKINKGLLTLNVIWAVLIYLAWLPRIGQASRFA